MENLSTNKQKQIIHMLKNKYAVSDGEYCELMYEHFSRASSTALTVEQADEFIHILSYKYSDDYRYGYEKAKDKYLNELDLEQIFVKNFNPTDLELKMFRMLDKEKQREILV